jgi:hypothetical protein
MMNGPTGSFPSPVMRPVPNSITKFIQWRLGSL